MEKQKILIICGPTAIGKTSLGLKIAKKFNGEIISADSRQVYKGMDIGTGKDIENSKWQKVKKPEQLDKFRIGYYLKENIKLWLLDIVDPTYQFSLADYKRCADWVIDNLLRKARLPIIVGGTGFYIKGIIDEIPTLGIPPDWELRAKLANLEAQKLREILKTISPERLEKMNKSDRNNPRRLIRAIEIAKFKPKTFESTYRYVNTKKDFLLIGLTAPYKVIYQKIDQRVEERVKKGIKEEIEKLLKKGFSWKSSVLGTTIGYKEWQDFFAGKISEEEVIQRWKFAEHNYSRRQLTWFKKDKRIHWFNITKTNWEEEVEKLIKTWYDN